MTISTGWLKAAALGAAVSGCGLGVVSHDIETSTLTPGEVRAATGGRQPVEVLGAPPDGAPAEAVATALRAPARYPATTYYVAPPASDGMRLVLEFGRRAGSHRSCVAPSGGSGGEGLLVAASLCQGETLQSTATLRAADVAGPSDRRFEKSMALLLRRVLVPDEVPEPFTMVGEDD